MPWRELSFLSFGKVRASYGVVVFNPSLPNATNLITVPGWDGWGGSLDPSFVWDRNLYSKCDRGNAYLNRNVKEEFEIGTIAFFSTTGFQPA